MIILDKKDMKYNPLDGDRAAEEYDRIKGKLFSALILYIYFTGQRNAENKIKYKNPYNKNKEQTKYLAYRNGYKSIKK